jgi:hypothetical protein
MRFQVDVDHRRTRSFASQLTPPPVGMLGTIGKGLADMARVAQGPAARGR